ncbi:MAG: hypothetical protein ABC596_05895 [Candidatus Methanosuratincola petrocarbonis]
MKRQGIVKFSGLLYHVLADVRGEDAEGRYGTVPVYWAVLKIPFFKQEQAESFIIQETGKKLEAKDRKILSLTRALLSAMEEEKDD